MEYNNKLQGNNEELQAILEMANALPDAESTSSQYYVTPQMFGAVADGVTDDTAAIQAAFDSLTDGGTIYFPSGKYIVQHSETKTGQDYIAVLVENKAGLTVVLDGGATIKHNLTSVNRYSLFSFYGCDGLEIRGGIIEGDRNEHPDATTGYGSKGIHIKNCDNVYIHDIEVWNIFGDCIGVSGTANQCKNILIENCKLHDCYRNGLTVGGIKRGIVRGCHIYNVDGGAPEAGIDIEAEYGYNNEDITIEDCYIHNCTQATITFSSNGNGTKVRGCTLDGSTMSVPTHTDLEIENTEIIGMLSVKNNCVLRNCTVNGFTSYGGTDFPNVDFKAYNTIFGGNATTSTFLVSGIQSIASYYFKDCEINHLENSSHSLFQMLNAGDTSIAIEGGKINLWNTNLDTPFATGNFSSFKLKGCQVLAKSPTMKKTLLSVSASTVQMVDNVVDMSEVESYSPTCVATFGTVVNTLNCHANTFVLGKNIQWILNLSAFTGSAYLTQNSSPMASGFCLSNAGAVFERGNTTSESVDLTTDGISDVVLNAGFITEIEAKGYVDGKIADFNAEGVQQTPLFANSIEGCTDTTKVYVLPDGYIYGYVAVEHPGGVPQFTNVLPLAINADGTLYNGGLGYKAGIKLSGTGAEESNNNYMSTGFIECKPNDVVRLKGFTKQKAGGNSVVPYTSSFGKYGNIGYPTWETDDFGVFTYTVNTPNNPGYVRFCVGTIAEDAIVTINEEIKYSEATTTYEWTNLGVLAFVSAERFLALEAEVAALKETIK